MSIISHTGGSEAVKRLRITVINSFAVRTFWVIGAGMSSVSDSFLAEHVDDYLELLNTVLDSQHTDDRGLTGGDSGYDAVLVHIRYRCIGRTGFQRERQVPRQVGQQQKD